eukprot:COSAG02_NODE_3338_length_6903_cov_13.687537_5_plen_79_part_00
MYLSRLLNKRFTTAKLEAWWVPPATPNLVASTTSDRDKSARDRRSLNVTARSTFRRMELEGCVHSMDSPIRPHFKNYC